MKNTRNKKILFTGGAGYIASTVIQYFIKNGVKESDIIVLDNLSNSDGTYIPSESVFVQCDLRNRSEVIKVFDDYDIGTVLHFASLIEVGESFKKPDLYFSNNVVGGLNLLDAMKKVGCKDLIFSSTCAVYGDPDEIPIKETERKKPINPYGESKFILEQLIRWYSEVFDINFAILRYFNAAGSAYGIKEGHDPETHIIPVMMRAILCDDEFLVFGDTYDTKDGTCVRDYLHVLDLASAHLKALERLKKGKSFEVNIGREEGNSIFDIIAIVEKVTNKKLNYSIVGKRSGDPDVLISDSSKAKKILNWRAKYTMMDIIKSIKDLY
jgi:UDP-glucose 4-epimerase